METLKKKSVVMMVKFDFADFCGRIAKQVPRFEVSDEVEREFMNKAGDKVFFSMLRKLDKLVDKGIIVKHDVHTRRIETQGYVDNFVRKEIVFWINAKCMDNLRKKLRLRTKYQFQKDLNDKLEKHDFKISGTDYLSLALYHSVGTLAPKFGEKSLRPSRDLISWLKSQPAPKTDKRIMKIDLVIPMHQPYSNYEDECAECLADFAEHQFEGKWHELLSKDYDKMVDKNGAYFANAFLAAAKKHGYILNHANIRIWDDETITAEATLDEECMHRIRNGFRMHGQAINNVCAPLSAESLGNSEAFRNMISHSEDNGDYDDWMINNNGLYPSDAIVEKWEKKYGKKAD